jgi:hypothetical protein
MQHRLPACTERSRRMTPVKSATTWRGAACGSQRRLRRLHALQAAPLQVFALGHDGQCSLCYATLLLGLVDPARGSFKPLGEEFRLSTSSRVRNRTSPGRSPLSVSVPIRIRCRRFTL